MKKLALFISILISCYSYSQELMNFYLEPNGSNEVSLHTMVFNSSYSTFGSYSLNAVDNTITVTLCYLNTSGQSITIDPQVNDINLPNGYSTYTINIELYGDKDAVQPCSLDNIVDTGSITFEYPYNPTATTYIPDNVFENYLENFGFGDDIANNDLVFTHRIINNTHLFLNDQYFELPGDIVNIEGVQSFINLKDIRCGNNHISSLDLSSNVLLERLTCNNNPLIQLNVTNNVLLNFFYGRSAELVTIDLSNNVNLEFVDIGKNNIETIDLSQNTNLVYLEIDDNLLTEIILIDNILLEYLNCSKNQISELDISNNNNLKTIYCVDNQILSINIYGLTNLQYVLLNYNQITSLDLSSNPQLIWVYLINNNLTSLNLKNGNNANIEYFVAMNNDDLFCIEVDNPDEAPYPGWHVEDQVVCSEDCSLGVNDILATQITCYPNPVQNILNINNTSSSPITSIEVYDLLGKLVLLEKSNTNQLNVSHLKSGIFFIKIETKQGVLTKKLVKK